MTPQEAIKFLKANAIIAYKQTLSFSTKIKYRANLEVEEMIYYKITNTDTDVYFYAEMELNVKPDELHKILGLSDKYLIEETTKEEYDLDT